MIVQAYQVLKFTAEFGTEQEFLGELLVILGLALVGEMNRRVIAIGTEIKIVLGPGSDRLQAVVFHLVDDVRLQDRRVSIILNVSSRAVAGGLFGVVTHSLGEIGI